MRWPGVVLLFGGLLAVPARADLKPALAETNLGKRSKLALDNAVAELKTAREAYAQGDSQAVAAAVGEIQQSVDLAYDSLVKTGKNPRSSPKWFKQAEIVTRELSKRLDSFQRDMDYADRPQLDPVKAGVQKVHDELLLGLMEGKRK